MRQLNDNTNKRKWIQITYDVRVKIEKLFKKGKSAREIALCVGYSTRTIQRELKRGMVEVTYTKYDELAKVAPDMKRKYITKTEYSAQVAENEHVEKSSYKGVMLKIGNNYALADYIEQKIGNEGLSPYATLQQAINDNEPFANLICLKTLYNYIDKDIFLNISNKDLWVKKEPKKRKINKVRHAHNNIDGRKIEERPKEIDERQEYGHWEMDTVVGKGKTVLLVLTERKTREEIIRKIPSKSQRAVINALNIIERKLGSKSFRKKFKTITMDNGCEFLCQEGIEHSISTKRQRTKVYYCHPYRACERGSNENANKMIRRFIPKGADISKFSDKDIQRIENYMNNYPRKILGGLSARQAA